MSPRLRDLANPSTALALSFGLGLIPLAPGTFGAAGAFPLYWSMEGLPWAWRACAVAMLFLAGCAACGRAEALLGDKDPKAVVWDETCGMLIVLILAPPGWVWWAAGFVAFRGLDILKPWPISWAERSLRGGLAIMLDDALAAAGAAAILRLAHAFA